MLVGLAALLVVWLCVPVNRSVQRLGVLAWNTVALLEIFLVLLNGVRLFLRDPALAEPFTVLPLALLPTFVIPLVLITHVLLFLWGRKQATTSV